MDNFYIEINKRFSEIENLFDKVELYNFIGCDYRNLDNYHFGLGTWIRNNLLEEKSELYMFFLQCGISQKDDISSLIIKLFYIHMQIKYK